MTTIRKLFPSPTECHVCGVWAAVTVCPNCKTERPAITALKNITERKRVSLVDVVKLAGKVC